MFREQNMCIKKYVSAMKTDIWNDYYTKFSAHAKVQKSFVNFSAHLNLFLSGVSHEK